MADDVQNILEHVGLFQQRMLQSDGRTHPIQVHLTQRFNQPWTNTKINRMSRKKKKLLHRAFKTKSSEDSAAYHEAKKYIQSECRKAYYRYINDMVAKPSEGEPHSLKRFWVFIRSRKCDNSGVSPLEKMGSLTVIAKSRRTSSMNNFRQSSPTRIQHLSLTWGPLRTLIWLTSTSTNQEYARY